MRADRDVALRGVLTGVAQADIAAAANLALTLPPGTEQRKGMELIIDQWSARAPDTSHALGDRAGAGPLRSRRRCRRSSTLGPAQTFRRSVIG